MGARMKKVESDTLGFEGAKEALHNRIVIAIGLSAHADSAVVLSEQELVVMSGILAASIRMVEQVGLRLTLGKCHVQSIVDKSRVAVSAHRPADNSP